MDCGIIPKERQCADLEEDKTVLIKEEKPEEDNEALSELKISDGGAGGPDAGGEEWATTANSGIAPSERTEDLTAQCRGRHSAWESADVEERRADVKEERLEEMKIREEGPGKWDAVCSHTSETLPGSLLDHSLPPAVKSAGNSQPTFQYPRSTQDLVATDSSPAEVEAEAEMSTAWSKDTGSGRIQIQHRHYNEGRERESAQSDSGTNMLFVHTQMGLSETPLASSAHSVNGFAACNQSLTPPQSRVCHQHTGTEKRKLICKYCGKGFNFSSEMKLHHRVHTGEKPFACTHCGRRFSQSCSLKKHQSVHTGEKPFSCIQCGKKFSDTGNLRRHMNVHTGYKPFRCVHCGKEYCDSRDLKRHQAIHTEKERQSGSVQWRLAYSST
ncbi:zinc finger protein 239-like isoform X2 [Megalops cyprinoides]|uniref:zinc finger protein 239-like isoform X2 n=1 Tax=Megalops cyprinoides TaxID=118141 RepID=UPI0018640215|nr:zinc finger protein 239-like isoform X2 [Megalops cyprinoides]